MFRAVRVRWAVVALTAVAMACGSFGVGADAGAPSEPVDGAAPPDGAPPGDAGAPTDADAPTDASSAPCDHGWAGTATPCTSCQVEELHLVPTTDAGGGPFIFGVATDGVDLYWLEQTGAGAYDGAGTSTSILRKRLGLASAAPEPLARLAGPYQHLAINGANMWVASKDAARAIVRVDRTCVGTCTFDNIVASVPVRSMVPYGAGVAVATGSSVVRLAAGSRVEQSAPAVAVTRSGDDLAYATEKATELAFVGSSATAPLLAASPNPGFLPFGASLVSGECGPALWAFQVFKKEIDGGQEALYTLTHTAVGATATGVAVGPPAFALAADATHAYLGNANGQGVARWAPGESNLTPVAAGKSAWSLAMTHDHVYFDDHGLISAKQSVGIYRFKKSR